jgi:ABC-type multidrug transport system permease subunit
MIKAPPLWWRQWRWRRYAGRHVATRRRWETFLAWADSQGLLQPMPRPVKLAVYWTATLAIGAMLVAIWYLAIHLFLASLQQVADYL